MGSILSIFFDSSTPSTPPPEPMKPGLKKALHRYEFARNHFSAGRYRTAMINMTYVRDAYDSEGDILESEYGITLANIDSIMSKCLARGGHEVRRRIAVSPSAVSKISDIYTVTDAILFKSLTPAKMDSGSNEKEVQTKAAIEAKWPKVSGCYNPTKKDVNFSKIIGYSELKNQLHDALILPCKFPSMFEGRINDTK